MMKLIADRLTTEELREYAYTADRVIDTFEDLRYTEDNCVHALTVAVTALEDNKTASVKWQRQKDELIELERRFYEKYKVNVATLTPVTEGDCPWK